MSKILHTEASTGWGGQEMRIMAEARGMRDRGHTVLFLTQHGAELAQRARDEGFYVEELDFRRRKALVTVPRIIRFLRKYKVDVVNTHSSLDSWVAGFAARLARCRVIRTRHLSAWIRPGLNSKVLYRGLADGVATTCEEAAEVIRQQAKLSAERCFSVPTGVVPEKLVVDEAAARKFREDYGIAEDEVLCGTLCVIRGWKGVQHLVEAAHKLRDVPRLRFVVVGSGPFEHAVHELAEELDLGSKLIFTGRHENPAPALAAMDIFALLSYANEGVSQAALQAAYLGKPLVTTPTGGLGEICQSGLTGLQVAANAPDEVAQAVHRLYSHPELRQSLGNRAQQMVKERFTMDHTLDQMLKLYQV